MPIPKSFLNNQKGALHLLILIAALGLISFLVISNTFSFKNKIFQTLFPKPASQASASLALTAVGDLGASTETTKILQSINNSLIPATLFIGDLSYNQKVPESAWCSYVKQYLPNSRIALISGNHEDHGENGLIDNFVNCLPSPFGTAAKGTYGKEYYVDYPPASPFVRLIMISPGLNFTNGGGYYYYKGSTHYNGVQTIIDQARSSNIKWVVAVMHENCMSMGSDPATNQPSHGSCEIGADLMNLLLSEKVDLILQGHDHNYQRSKQLALSSGCSAITIDGYNSQCVVNNGSTNHYTKGQGSVLTITGSGGSGTLQSDGTYKGYLYNINTSDPEAGYFAKWMGNNINPTFGYSKITISGTQISSEFIPAAGGNFTDSFTIY